MLNRDQSASTTERRTGGNIGADALCQAQDKRDHFPRRNGERRAKPPLPRLVQNFPAPRSRCARGTQRLMSASRKCTRKSFMDQASRKGGDEQELFGADTRDKLFDARISRFEGED